jgi:deoxyribonuclease-4
MLLGAHVSIAGGISQAPARGAEIGGTAIQIFTKNQVQWKSAPLHAEEIQKFKTACFEKQIQAVCVHDSYLINLGSTEPELLARSRQAFTEEICRTAALGIPFLVFHPGAYKSGDAATCLQTIAESLDFCLDAAGTTAVQLLLETTSGQGTNVGYRFEQLAHIIERARQPACVGVCLDTCHIFTAGYDIRDAQSYGQTMAEFARVVGLDKLKIIHLNDSRKPLGSRVDRHENIGRGLIGLEAFRLLLTDPRLKTVPKILETPGGDDWYRTNLELLKSLVTENS